MVSLGFHLNSVLIKSMSQTQNYTSVHHTEVNLTSYEFDAAQKGNLFGNYLNTYISLFLNIADEQFATQLVEKYLLILVSAAKGSPLRRSIYVPSTSTEVYLKQRNMLILSVIILQMMMTNC